MKPQKDGNSLCSSTLKNFPCQSKLLRFFIVVKTVAKMKQFCGKMIHGQGTMKKQNNRALEGISSIWGLSIISADTKK